MKAIGLTALFCMVAVCAASAYPQWEPYQCADYRGKRDTCYFYKDSLNDISITDSYQNDGDILLEEYAASGKPNGTLNLRFVELDPSRESPPPLTRDVLKGTWIHGPGDRNLPVFLSLTGMRAGKCSPRYDVAGASDDFAVLKGRKSLAAEYVSYPAASQLSGKRRKLANSAEFLRFYGRIFTKKFVAQLATGVPPNMFANSPGIMLADGAVWFDEFGRATVFNNAQ
jgi:hypothetical protein